MIQTTTTEKINATAAADFNTGSKAEANVGRKDSKDGTQAEADTVCQKETY